MDSRGRRPVRGQGCAMNSAEAGRSRPRSKALPCRWPPVAAFDTKLALAAGGLIGGGDGVVFFGDKTWGVAGRSFKPILKVGPSSAGGGTIFPFVGGH